MLCRQEASTVDSVALNANTTGMCMSCFTVQRPRHVNCVTTLGIFCFKLPSVTLALRRAILDAVQ